MNGADELDSAVRACWGSAKLYFAAHRVVWPFDGLCYCLHVFLAWTTICQLALDADETQFLVLPVSLW